jgi:hypothetical protein
VTAYYFPFSASRFAFGRLRLPGRTVRPSRRSSRRAVAILEDDRLPSLVALNHLMWQTRDDDAGKARHGPA